MPKQKTNKSAAKRFSMTASGRVTHKRQGMRHMLSKRNRKVKQDLRKKGVLSKAEVIRVRALLRK